MNLDTILPLVNKPSRYLGKEFNLIKKNWENADVRMVLVFPDLYEIGMSHQGLQILYHIVNNRKYMLAERAYVPDCDMEGLLRKDNVPLFSLESRKPLREFDILGITLPYELCFTNILTVLDLAGLPFRAIDRDESFPLVIGGGPCAFNPEPIADFFDAILLGDGEEAILEIAEVVRKAKRDKLSRKEALAALRKIDGVYVPAMFAPQYDDEGNFRKNVALDQDYTKVKRRFLADLEDTDGITAPLVPISRIVHDRLGVEIARGCTRGCRFCQAGIIYRPVRERSPERIMELARQGIAGSGFEELALLSLSTGDYSCLSGLMVELMNTFTTQRVSVSMPSMRVGTLTPEIMEQIRRVRKTGFTVAPEAGSERLRRVINKGITEEDLLDTCKAAFELGWRTIKFYFMIGLPTETMDDVEAIADLAHKAFMAGGKSGRITVSVGTYVPKAHTPFQREAQISVEEGYAKIDLLKKRLGRKAFTLKWQDPRQSFLEGVMARGDRRLAMVIEETWRRGVRLDGWSEHFDPETWQRAAVTCGVDLENYLRRRRPDEALPWQHLDTGVDDAFLLNEYEKALAEAYTPDCRVHGCQKCGLCDFKGLQPRTFNKLEQDPESVDQGKDATWPGVFSGGKDGGKAFSGGVGKSSFAGQPRSGFERPHFIYKIRYSILGPVRFFSHLEKANMFFGLFRRVGLPLHFSQGFNPSPKVSFSPALPVGTESEDEYLLVDLDEELNDPAETKKFMNSQLPEGFKIKDIDLDGFDDSGMCEATYEIYPAGRFDVRKLRSYGPGKTLIVTVKRKGKAREIDVRPLVKDFQVTREGTVRVVLLSEPGLAGVKPLELVAAILGLSPEDMRLVRVLKVRSVNSNELVKTFGRAL